MFRRLSIALLAAAVLVPLSAAQMRGAHSGFGRGVRANPALRHSLRPFARPFGEGVNEGSFLGWPLPYSDDSTAPYLLEGASPPIVVLQQAAADDSSRKFKPQPLLIELRGDRYVRFGGITPNDEAGSSTHTGYSPEITQPAASLPERAASPTLLVYRDGHREEISDYAIADGVIYVRGDYWQNGDWTKRIPLSAVDAPATMKANQQRRVKFLLPSAPNVVIASF
jgi:hypothetical protein